MYKIFLTEGEFSGKSTDGSWKKAPDVPIVKMEYYYTMTRKLVLQGYKEYNHLVEKMAIVGTNETILSKIFVMGRTETETHIFTIDLRSRRVSSSVVPIGQEYNGQVISGWKPGVLNNPGWDDGVEFKESNEPKYKWDKA